MSKKMREIRASLKELGEIEIKDADLGELMHTDISDLEISKSLRKLGNCQVTDWELKDVIPAVSKLAHKEVDVAGMIKRTADYKVMEWDFRNVLHGEKWRRLPDAEEMQALILRLKSFLEYTVTNLIEQPQHAQIKVSEIKRGVLNFKLLLTKRDVTRFIGTEGHTAAAVRNTMKSVAARQGVHLLLKVHSHEEEASSRLD